MNAVGAVAVIALLLTGTGGKPLRTPRRGGAEWFPTGEDAFPFSPKPIQYMSMDHSGGIVPSYCTREHEPHGVNGQICFPLSFWVSVCRANVSSADAVLSALLEEDADLDAVHAATWHDTCFRYGDTWPHCVSKAKEGLSVKHYCNLWKALPEWERLLMKGFYEVYELQKETHVLPVSPKTGMPCKYFVS
ncbi:hypothetical protein PAV19gp24 [Psittacine adenovirus 3]|uniref:Uncharacterized protein n=1 Tax=Psittacine adenovirus 3 TaxID=1580497 RepID=A0A0A7JW93_9ADEN|nr:hypothetical protein SC17_gp24 [Psittacine adenovirus 3]AIZ35785.1 hypothetical protein PAV19gp24 [Psittacine adenovirus 3]